MKIVIDIPEEAYKILKNEGVDWLGAEHILNAVANGTPLPKGHGDLIDVDELFRKHPLFDTYPFPSTAIDNAPRIIKADKEE